jgi:hypothetical protein
MRSVVEGLCSFAGRGACTDAERRAAAWLHDELRSRVHEAWVETRWLRPQRAAALALGCLLGVAGSLLAASAPVAGLAVAATGALSMLLEAAGWTGPIRALFPRRATQHVLTDVIGTASARTTSGHGTARHPPGGDETNRGHPPGADDSDRGHPPGADDPDRGHPPGADDSDRGHPPGADDPTRGQQSSGDETERGGAGAPVLVIAAAYDAPRRGLLLNDRWRRWLRRAPPGALPACAVAVVAAAGARVGGADGVAIGAVQLVPTLVLLAAMAGAADVALSDWAPGANDCASGVAVALALFDELTREPPRALAPMLLLVGAGHAGPGALRSHLRAERLGADRVIVVELGPCGAGRPAWRARHPRMEAAAERAAVALALADPAQRHDAPVDRVARSDGDGSAGQSARSGSDGAVGQVRRSQRPNRPTARVPGVRIACLDDRGLTPRAHQEDDTEVDARAMEAALDLALGVVDALDAELATAAAPAPSPRA